MPRKPDKAKGKPGTVSTRTSNRRAGDKPLLFYQLEKFVNLKDAPSEFREMYGSAPEFLPVTFYRVEDDFPDDYPQAIVAKWDDSFYELLLVFRNMLRDVWKSASRSKLAILFGTDVTAGKIVTGEGRCPPIDPFFPVTDHSLIQAAIDKIDDGVRADLDGLTAAYPKLETDSTILPDWRTGTFRFDFQRGTEFRQALYELFVQSWRAKVCPRCARYFIADKPAQAYCSSKCYGEAKKERDVQFWRTVGSKRRRQRKRRRRE